MESLAGSATCLMSPFVLEIEPSDAAALVHTNGPLPLTKACAGISGCFAMLARMLPCDQVFVKLTSGSGYRGRD